MKLKYIHNTILVALLSIWILPLNANGEGVIVFDDEKIKKEVLEVNLYPNPVSDKLTIVFPDVLEKEIQIKLVDITGRLTYQTVLREKREFKIDFNEYSKGLYILNFYDEKGDILKISKIQKL